MTGELEVQKYLRAGATISDLAGAPFNLRVYAHPTLPLVGLKYDQIDSPRFDPIVRECRGLVLEKDTWNVVAKPFPRFYNLGECKADEERFDPNGATLIDKEDGSLILVYWYRGEWHVNTSGSFGLGEVLPGGPTWRELFWKTAGFSANDLDRIHDGPNSTYIFELCAHENKVVRRYATPKVFLIGSFINELLADGRPYFYDRSENDLDAMALCLGCARPRRERFFKFSHPAEYIAERVKAESDFEGVVLRDKNNIRLKVKSAEYLALAHMKDNGNLFREKNLVPWALREDPTELLIHFPECEEKLRKVSYDVHKMLGEIQAVYHAYRGVADQKTFALAIKDKTKYTGPLFAARKKNGPSLGDWDEINDSICLEPDRVAKMLYGD